MIVHILLPKCTHTDHNVFFNILKNIVHKVGRAKLTDHFLDNAFKEGMAGECQVDLNAAATWNVLSSREDQISQSKLLGRWAIRNYPTFGKILFGDSWKTTDLSSDIADEVDSVVFPKMKCVLVELDVVQSTSTNLIDFIQVPIKEITVENTAFKFSQKMKMYDIKANSVAKCWVSLKRGGWSVSNELNNPRTSKQARVNSECVAMHPRDHYNPTSLARKQACGSNMNKQLHSESARASDSFMGPDAVVPLDLTRKQSHDGELSVNNPDFARKPTTNEQLRERVTVLQEQLLVALQRELDQKNSQLDEQKKLVVEAQKSVVVLITKTEALAGQVVDLESELNQKVLSSAEVANANQALQLQFNEKCGSLAEIQKLVVDLKSELNRTESSLAEFEKSNNDLQLQLNEKSSLLTQFEGVKHDLQVELDQKTGLLAQVQKSVVDLESELNRKVLSSAEVENANQALQLQFNEKCGSLAETQKLVVDLKSELNRTESSLAEFEKSNNDLQLQLNEKSSRLTLFEGVKHDLQVELDQKTGLLAQVQKSVVDLESELNRNGVLLGEIEEKNRALHGELGHKNEHLTEMMKLKTEIEGAIDSLELQLCNKELSLGELEKGNEALQLELGQKNELLAETQKLKNEIQNTIVGLESNLNQKELSLNVLKKENHDLRLELNRKNELLAEMSQVKQEVFTDVPVTIRSTSVETTMPVSETMDTQNPKPDEPFETDDEIVKMCRPILLGLQFAWIKFSEKDKFRPGFIHLPDADGSRRAQEVTSDGYISDDKIKFYHFETDIPECKKAPAQIKKLKVLNKKFKFSLK